MMHSTDLYWMLYYGIYCVVGTLRPVRVRPALVGPAVLGWQGVGHKLASWTSALMEIHLGGGDGSQEELRDQIKG